MKRRGICLLILFALLTGMGVMAADDTGYLFETAEAITDEALLRRVDVISARRNVYRTEAPAVLLELEAAGQLLIWEEDTEVSLIGLEAELAELDDAPWTDALLGMGYAWEHGITGAGVTVGMVDSGLWDGFGEKMQVKIADGTNFLESEQDPERRADTADHHGHGTAVASVLASVAPGAELVPLKCFESSTTKTSLVAEAIYAAVDVYHCDVLNLSLGLQNDDWVLCDAILYAYENRVLITAASGNLTGGRVSTGSDRAYYPAAYPEVVSVGAVDRYRSITAVSVQNDSVWTVAPGQSIQTCGKSGGSATWSGTSLAAPFVAGAAALALSVAPTLRPAGFFDLLAETAEDRGSSGYDNTYGYGLLNIGLLLAVLREDSEGIVISGSSDGHTVSAYVPETENGYQAILAQYGPDGRFLSAGPVMTGTGRILRNLPISDLTKEFTLFILENGAWRPLHSETRYAPVEASGGNDLPPVFNIPA